MKRITYLTVLLLTLLLTGCPDKVHRLPPQAWKNFVVAVETRPPVIERGMMEFLIIANEDQKRPAKDLIVDLSLKGSGKKQQAIQDGEVGVYRRALMVQDPINDILVVEIRSGDDQGILEFPLGQQGKAAQAPK